MYKTLVALTIFLAALIQAANPAAASLKYECWTYVNGSPDKMTYVTANSKSEAIEIATAKFRDLGASGYVDCK